MARKKADPTLEEPALETWDAPEDEHLEDQDQGEGGDAADEDLEADLAARSTTDHDSTEGDTMAAGLSARQIVGLDPTDPTTHQEQANDRRGLTNAQTDHEAANALDPVSGTPNPGVVDTGNHSAPGSLGASDMSGNLPKADVLSGLGDPAKTAMEKLNKASTDAKAQGDKGRGHGYVSLRDLGVSKAVMDSLVKDGKAEQETRPGGQFSPETGTVYCVKGYSDS